MRDECSTFGLGQVGRGNGESRFMHRVLEFLGVA